MVETRHPRCGAVRSVVVNLDRVSHVIRGDNETATVYLKGRSENLPVSRSYLHHFRQM